MEVFCTKNNTIYTTLEFLKAHKSDIESFYNHLICNSCKANAYYRKKSRDGKKAHFFSRPHNPGCTVATNRTTLTPAKQADIEYVQQIIARDDLIKIDFTALSDSLNKSHPTTNQTRQQLTSLACTTRQHTEKSARTRVSSFRLRTILNSLLYDSNFTKNDLIIEVNGFKRSISELFVKFNKAKPVISDATKKHIPHFYWGTLSYMDENMTWLNTGGKCNIGIPVNNFKAALFERFNIKGKENTVGRQALIYGYCISSNYGKSIRISVNNVSHIYISK